MSTPSIPLKRCSKCGEEKPATLEYFCKRKSGLNGHCKQCQVIHRLQHRDRQRELSRQWYINNRERVLKSVQQWAVDNPEKVREAKLRWYHRNREKVSVYRRQYRVTVREKEYEYGRRWQRENPEKVRAKARRYYISHREERLKATQQWYLDNPEKGRENNRKRRARKASQIATFAAEHERLALDYFNGCCAVCNRQLKDLFGTHTVHWDHWIPLSKGGSTTPDNMVPLCGGLGGCNNRKHDTDPVEWVKRTFTPRKAKQILQRIEAYFMWVRGNDDR